MRVEDQDRKMIIMMTMKIAKGWRKEEEEEEEEKKNLRSNIKYQVTSVSLSFLIYDLL